MDTLKKSRVKEDCNKPSEFKSNEEIYLILLDCIGSAKRCC